MQALGSATTAFPARQNRPVWLGMMALWPDIQTWGGRLVVCTQPAVLRYNASAVLAGVTEEKEAAMQALGIYAEATGAAFAPEIEPSLATLLQMANYFHEGVREQAYEALPSVLKATQAAFPSPSCGRSTSTESVLTCSASSSPSPCAMQWS